MAEPAKTTQQQQSPPPAPVKYVCLKYIEAHKPGDVIKPSQLPVSADIEFLLGTSAMRAATAEEAAKDKVILDKGDIKDQANRLIDELKKQVDFQTAKCGKLEHELIHIQKTLPDTAAMEKQIAALSGEAASLKVTVKQLTEENQKLKDEAAQQ